MAQNTLKKLETLIQESAQLDADKQQELLDLIASLKTELHDVDEESAHSIAKFAEVATHEALRENKNADLIEISTQGLEKSTQEFAATQPTLFNIVRTIVRTLSNMGI